MIAFAGAVQRDARACNDAGIDAFSPILRGVVTLEEAMKNENAKQNLADTARAGYQTDEINKRHMIRKLQDSCRNTERECLICCKNKFGERR